MKITSVCFRPFLTAWRQTVPVRRIFRMPNDQEHGVLRSFLSIRYDLQRENKNDRGEETPAHERDHSVSQYGCQHLGTRQRAELLQTRRYLRPRLSLSQRERMKVRVCLPAAPPVRTRSLATRCPALGEPDDSRTATQRLHVWRRIPTAFDREFGLHGSMATAVQFDSQLCARAIEIQHVIVEPMSASKFVASKTSIPQVSPKNTLRLSRLLSQQSSAIHEDLF